ncbi:hypothetical protein ZIOFF_008043 [Zingiber officinale]|uniref:Methyltransferase n=1 Tax=Zingiber officinale TaxID=94328 RepID=A0A8J5HVI5_ZINOF|nr:hypothetical protein ZIOFF_008043 [Zingiber officinale]
MSFSNDTFDAIYAIEATCHALDVVGCYKEIYRVLKLGQYFAAYEWCMIDHYNPSNESHKKAKAEIELGNGLLDVRTTRQCLNALKLAGFEVIWEKDLASDSPVPWYLPLDTSWFLITTSVKALEFVRIAPAGSNRVSSFLEKATEGLVARGRMEIFTPISNTLDTPQIGMYFSFEEEVRAFYKSYAQGLGFGISKLGSKKGNDDLMVDAHDSLFVPGRQKVWRSFREACHHLRWWRSFTGEGASRRGGPLGLGEASLVEELTGGGALLVEEKEKPRPWVEEKGEAEPRHGCGWRRKEKSRCGWRRRRNHGDFRIKASRFISFLFFYFFST